MLYYVKTGDFDTSLNAKSHKHAAKKIVGNGDNCGICVIVSEKEIIEENADENVYFLTENLIPKMRVVG